MLNGLTWVHWANSRITEKESNVKNKENGSDGALLSSKRDRSIVSDCETWTLCLRPDCVHTGHEIGVDMRGGNEYLPPCSESNHAC